MWKHEEVRGRDMERRRDSETVNGNKRTKMQTLLCAAPSTIQIRNTMEESQSPKHQQNTDASANTTMLKLEIKAHS